MHTVIHLFPDHHHHYSTVLVLYRVQPSPPGPSLRLGLASFRPCQAPQQHRIPPLADMDMAPAGPTPPASPTLPKQPRKRGLFSLPRMKSPALTTAEANATSVKLAMRHLIEERDELRELLRGRDLVVMQLNNEVMTLAEKVKRLKEKANNEAPAGAEEEEEKEGETNDAREELAELQRRFDDLTKEAESLRAEVEAAKKGAAADGVEQAREHEWTLRSLETEIEAQAQWRQSVVESLQERLDEKSKEAESLRVENATLKADASASASKQVEVKENSASSLSSLEAELEAQAQWRRRVAEDLQRRLDDKTAEADALRAEVAEAKSAAAARGASAAGEEEMKQLTLRHKDEKEKLVHAMEEAHKFSVSVLQQTVAKKDSELDRLMRRVKQLEEGQGKASQSA